MSADVILLDDLDRSVSAVAAVIDQIGPDQWSAPTPCVEWEVRRVVLHLSGMNRVFVAMLEGRPPPQRGPEPPDDRLAQGFVDSADELAAAFRRPGMLEASLPGPLGAATGRERLQIRSYDLVAHGWDLARATGYPLSLADEVADRSLAFVRTQLLEGTRANRFGTAQPAPDGANGIDRLAAFLGRPLDWTPPDRA